MKAVRCAIAVMGLVLCMAPALSAQQDVPGSKDHPLFNRMPGFYISSYDQKEFASHTFRDEKFREVEVEGRYTRIAYEPVDGSTKVSTLQIHRNYENAVKRIGGTVLYSDDEYSFMRLTRDGREIWVELTAYGPKPDLVIVERDAMKQDIVADAAVFRDGIRSTGHAAVYGIYFDTDQSVIKPGSEAALEEIAKLLRSDPALKVRLVGHTDATGNLDHNLALSEARAKAVLAALTSTYGIPAARLSAHGVGPLAPVAANGSEDGRAKNRRVELVGW